MQFCLVIWPTPFQWSWESRVWRRYHRRTSQHGLGVWYQFTPASFKTAPLYIINQDNSQILSNSNSSTQMTSSVVDPWTLLAIQTEIPTWQVAPGKSPTQADVSAPRMEGSGQLPGSSVVVPGLWNICQKWPRRVFVCKGTKTLKNILSLQLVQKHIKDYIEVKTHCQITR